MKTPIQDTLSLITRDDVREKMRTAKSALPAFPLLEYPLDEIRQIEDQLPREAQIKDILRAALISPAGYWASSALEWIISGFPIDDEINKCYQVCKLNNRIPQRIRQPAHSIFTKQQTQRDVISIP